MNRIWQAMVKFGREMFAPPRFCDDCKALGTEVNPTCEVCAEKQKKLVCCDMQYLTYH